MMEKLLPKTTKAKELVSDTRWNTDDVTDELVKMIRVLEVENRQLQKGVRDVNQIRRKRFEVAERLEVALKEIKNRKRYEQFLKGLIRGTEFYDEDHETISLERFLKMFEGLGGK